MKVIGFTLYDLDETMRKLKDIQLVIKNEYIAKLELGYNCYLINIYKNE